MECGEEGGGVAGEGKDAIEWKDRGDPAEPESSRCWGGLLSAADSSS